MIKQLDYKVKDGKLVRIEAEIDGDLIAEISITGDFFIYPETAIVQLEDLLKGTLVSDAQKRLQEFLSANDITIIGFCASDIVHMLMEMKG